MRYIKSERLEIAEAGFLVRAHPEPCLILSRAHIIEVKVHPCLDLNFAGSR
jgi:hypothetical protein